MRMIPCSLVVSDPLSSGQNTGENVITDDQIGEIMSAKQAQQAHKMHSCIFRVLAINQVNCVKADA